MNERIKSMINNIIDSEGGYVNHPSDKGGPTKYGITLGTLTTWRARLCTDSDIKALQRWEAFEIYYDVYYLRSNINKLPELLQPHILDCAVNHGKQGAIKMLQRQLLADGFPLSADGICGKITLKTTQAAIDQLGNTLLNNLINRRKQYYQAIVANNKSQSVFIKGWLARAETFRPEDNA